MTEFRTQLGSHIFHNKYALHRYETWHERAGHIVEAVCNGLLSRDEKEILKRYITEFKFLPGGRYIYYAGRKARFYNNCYLFKCEEDTREEWANVTQRCINALMTGGGVGVDYSILREEGAPIARTGGTASGPIPLMHIINEAGRNVMQGGSRRSAIYASLHWNHPDIQKFLHVKDWHSYPVGNSGLTLKEAKQQDFNFPAPLDMTNISVNYDDGYYWNVFLKNCEQAMKSGEPGFSFNFGEKRNETLRNACTEVTSSDDSDVCNLGSINLAAISSLDELAAVSNLASKFLVCGTLVADLPSKKIMEVRAKNRRLGLGLMGVHEWLLKRGFGYEVNEELERWLASWAINSEAGANSLCDSLGINRPVAYRAIAPTGTIGILAGTTTGIEPIYAVAYKRRYLTSGVRWNYEYVIDSTAKDLIERFNLNPDSIETALDLSSTPEKRISFQADIQDYVDMAVSSTVNLPAWGTDNNNEDKVHEFATTLAKYAKRLRGITFYPDGSRGGQPLSVVDFATAMKNEGVVFEEHDMCKGGVCGI